MKKQILILLVVMLTGIQLIFGQSPSPNPMPIDPSALTAAPTYCPTPTPITASCIVAPGPLNPTPGLLYTYSVNVTPNNPSAIYWFVTTDPQFITGGTLTSNIEVAGTSDYVMATGTSYNNNTNTSTSVDITWQAFPTTADVFLVTYVRNAAGCTDNIKVYKIVAQHTFTLDLARIAFDGTNTAPTSHCVSPVQGAQFDGTQVLMDYGVNYIYFVVNAANWAHSWMPSFQLSATNTTASSVLEVHWAYPDQSSGATPTWNTTTAVGGIYTSNTAVLPHLVPGATGVGSGGECIIVRVTVDHNLNETLADIVLDLGVNGIMYDQVNANYTNSQLADIAPVDGPGGVCPWFDDYTNDHLGYTLTLRPTVVDATPDIPTPTNFIPDNAE